MRKLFIADKKKLTSYLLLLLAFPLLSACGLFDKDNTPVPSPLVQFTPDLKPIRLWSVRAGSGVGDEYLKMGPAVGKTAIFTGSTTGIVTSINKANGQINWQVNTGFSLMTPPGIGEGLIAFGTREGEVLTLRQSDGKTLWKVSLPGEILAQPAIAEGCVVVKTIDGDLKALSSTDGHEFWTFQQTEPNLILRGSSAPFIRDHAVIAGFANGQLAQLNLRTGQTNWIQAIAVPEGAFAIQRMIDIDADPILFERHIYAATYQGKIAALDWTSGHARWSQTISSYTGMVADDATVYLSDASSTIWALRTTRGDMTWHQTKLEARVVTGPALMGSYLVVGDAEGYIHWLNKHDGHFAARDYIGASIYAAPVMDGQTLYVLNNAGSLVAYTLG